MNFYKEHPFLCKLITIVALFALIMMYLNYGHVLFNKRNTGNKHGGSITYPVETEYDINLSEKFTFHTDTHAEKTHYKSEFIELAAGTHMVPYLATTIDNCLYYVTMEGNSPDTIESYTVWCENFENGHTTEQIIQLPADKQTIQMTVDKEHNIYIFTKTRVDMYRGEIARYYMTKYNKSGEAIWFREISDDIIQDEFPKQETDTDYYCYGYDYSETTVYHYLDSYFFENEGEYSLYDLTCSHVDNNGIIYVANHKGMAVFRSNGKLLTWIDDTFPDGFIHDRKGNSYLTFTTPSRDYEPKQCVYSVCNINLYGLSDDTSYNFGGDNSFRYSDYNHTTYFSLNYTSETVFSSGLNYDILTKSDTALYGCDFNNKTATEILCWANVGIDGKDVDYFAELADGRFIVMSHCFEDKPVETAIISPINDMDYAKKIITLGVYWVDEYTEQVVREYNKTQDDYLVEIIPLYNISDRSECDIFAIDGNSPMAEQYVEEGKIENLTPYFETSNKISTEDFLTSVVEAHTHNDVLIGIPSRTYLALIPKESAGGTADWSLEDMKTLISNNPTLKKQLDVGTVAYTLAYYNLHNFVNLEDGSSSFYLSDLYEHDERGNRYVITFEESDFRTITEYSNTFVRKTISDTLPEGFMKLYDNETVYLNNVKDLYETVTNEDGHINLDNLNEYTGILWDNSVTFCISSSSEKKLAAWHFLEYIYSTASASSFKFGSHPVSSYMDDMPTKIDIIEKENQKYIESYDSEYSEYFMQILSESTAMKYNISVPLLKYIVYDLKNDLEDQRKVELGYQEDIEEYIAAYLQLYY